MLCRECGWDFRKGQDLFAPEHRRKSLGPVGFEPTDSSCKQKTYDSTDTNTAPKNAKTAANDPDLAKVIDTWPDLPGPIKTAILALVQSSQQTQGKPAGDATETNTEEI